MMEAETMGSDSGTRRGRDKSWVTALMRGGQKNGSGTGPRTEALAVPVPPQSDGLLNESLEGWLRWEG